MKKLQLVLLLIFFNSAFILGCQFDLDTRLRTDVVCGWKNWVLQDLYHGARADVRFNGKTLLHFIPMCTTTPYPAADLREIITYLVRDGVDINSLDEQNNTPLNFCFVETDSGLKCKSFLVKVFLEAGANPDIKNNQGVSPADKIKRILSTSDEYPMLREIAINFGIINS